MEIPRNGRLQARFQGDPRTKTALFLDLCTVNRVTPVMARPVGHIAQEAFTGYAPRCGRVWKAPAKFLVGAEFLINNSAHHTHQSYVFAFGAAADVVHLTDPAVLQYCLDAAAMVLHVQPVPDVTPIAIHGQRLPREKL